MNMIIFAFEESKEEREIRFSDIYISKYHLQEYLNKFLKPTPNILENTPINSPKEVFSNEPQQAPEPVEKLKTDLPDDYENLSNVNLVPYVMESLGLDPLAYSLETISKEDIYNKAKELYDKKFRMTFESFSRGGNSTWHKAKKQDLIKKQ